MAKSITGPSGNSGDAKNIKSINGNISIILLLADIIKINFN